MADLDDEFPGITLLDGIRVAIRIGVNE